MVVLGNIPLQHPWFVQNKNDILALREGEGKVLRGIPTKVSERKRQ